MTDDYVETARLLARFKLQVRRTLNRSVDLEAMTYQADYAARILREIEDVADDEELLVTILALRPRLLGMPPTPPARDAVTEEPSKNQDGRRHYRFGARAG